MPGSWGRRVKVGNGKRAVKRLADDFEDGSVSPRWTQFAFGSVTGAETSGLYTFSVSTSGTGGASLSTAERYDMSGASFVTEMTSAGAQEAGLQAYPAEFQIDSNNRVFLVIGNGFIGTYQTVAGVTTDHGFTAYNAVTHRWFRLREASGTTYWEAGADGVSWTTLASAANPIDVTDVTLIVGADTFLTLGSTKTVSISRVGI